MNIILPFTKTDSDEKETLFNNPTAGALCSDITFGDISVFDSMKREH